MKKKVGIIILVLVILIIIAVLSVIFLNNEKSQDGKESRWKTKEIYVNSLTEKITDATDIAVIPRWEELTIYQQFSNVRYNESNYDCWQGKVPTEMIGENLGIATLSGYDEYSKNTYTKNGTIYTIKNISKECAIAIQLDGTNEYYSYVNSYYRPETLGEFIEDLNLKEIISFGSIWYDDVYTDEEGNTHYDNIEFPEVDDETIWKMLFSNTSVENVHNDSSWYGDTVMSVSVDIPILGYKNISCSVTENGYLETNILDTGKTFYIGKDKVQEFVNYILDNYEGYKIVYVDAEGNRSDEEFDEDDNVSTADDVIVQTGNNVVEDVIVYMENGVEGEKAVTRENEIGNNVIAHSVE